MKPRSIRMASLKVGSRGRAYPRSDGRVGVGALAEQGLEHGGVLLGRRVEERTVPALSGVCFGEVK
jgi:hypothetical protein